MQNGTRDIFSRCKIGREIFSRGACPPGAGRLPPGGPRGAGAPLGQKYAKSNVLCCCFDYSPSFLFPLGGLIIIPKITFIGALRPWGGVVGVRVDRCGINAGHFCVRGHAQIVNSASTVYYERAASCVVTAGLNPQCQASPYASCLA